MKKKTKILSLMLMFGFFGLIFSACEKDESFDADDAKTELINASEEIQMNMFMMTGTPQMESLMFLFELTELDFEIDLKSSFKSFSIAPERIVTPGMNQIMDLSREVSANKKMNAFEDGGIFEYDFDLGYFDKVSDAVYIELRFPANHEAYAAQSLNAVLRIDNLVIDMVVFDDYPEEVPTSADVTLHIDNQQVLTLEYRMTVGAQMIPTAVTLDMQMPPYSMNMTYGGSGTNYTVDMTMAHNGNTLADIDLDITFAPDMEDVARVSGKVQLTPLEFSGSIEPMAMDHCEDAADEASCMNNHIDVELWHTGENKKIGDVEFRLYEDPWGDFYPELVIVYEDGSYDFFIELFDIDEGDFLP